LTPAPRRRPGPLRPRRLAFSTFPQTSTKRKRSKKRKATTTTGDLLPYTSTRPGVAPFPSDQLAPFPNGRGRCFGSSLGDTLRYNPSDCFDTFPCPAGWIASASLEAPGRKYYEARAAIMTRDAEGLTTTYNRFHDPAEASSEIVLLRKLHGAMDRVVLDAYGWTDIQPTCEFLLDYEEEEDADAAPSRRRKPWRYRWPDEIRDEVLGRLLALNKERAGAERREEVPAGGKAGKKSGSTRHGGPSKVGDPDAGPLIGA